jgi:ADP-heptose:LPS heptosyltransferase
MPEFTFVQTGMPDDEILSGVIDARGLTIRQTAALLSNTILFIGLEGGLMHLAKAVTVKSTIIYGGYIKPQSSAYSDDLVFSTNPECSPCYSSERKQIPCDNMICMKPIIPETVAKKIKEFIGKNNLNQ